MDSRPELRFAYGGRRRNQKFGRSDFLFGEIASNRRQNFLPSPLVMVKRGTVKKQSRLRSASKEFRTCGMTGGSAKPDYQESGDAVPAVNQSLICAVYNARLSARIGESQMYVDRGEGNDQGEVA
jgi:hypothetical protein